MNNMENFEQERSKVLAELTDYAAEHNGAEVDYTNEQQEKFALCCNTDNSIFPLVLTWRLNYGVNVPIFLSNEIAEKAIEAVGKERLLKYYFGIKPLTNFEYMQQMDENGISKLFEEVPWCSSECACSVGKRNCSDCVKRWLNSERKAGD